MNRKIFLLVLLLSLPLMAGAQRRDDWRRQYEQFKQERRREYRDFKAKANAEYAEFLKQAWKDFKPRAAEEAPIPVVMPEPQQAPVQGPVAPLPEAKPDLEEVRRISDPEPAAPARPAAPEVPRASSELALAFYGDAVAVPWSEALAPRLNSVDEKGFSAFWTDLSDAGADAAIAALGDYAEAHALNGWGYYQLVRKLSEQAYPADRPDERIALQAWLLSQLKFKAQVAATSGRLVLLLPFEEQVFGVPYLTLGGERYYIYGYGDAPSGGYRTYEKEFAYADRRLSLAMDGRMRVGLEAEMEIPRWSALLGERLAVHMGVGNIALLQDYPLIENVVYYRQGVPEGISKAVLPILRRKIAAMNETQAAGFLLDLVQHGFEYVTDEAAFGRQKQLFIEESFFYGRNNCKDRVGVYSWLVRELMGLDVIFIRFEGNAASNGISHIACAVAFKGQVAGDGYTYRGRRYVMCDPTYINAGVGRTMPCYKDSEAIVVTL